MYNARFTNSLFIYMKSPNVSIDSCNSDNSTDSAKLLLQVERFIRITERIPDVERTALMLLAGNKKKRRQLDKLWLGSLKMKELNQLAAAVKDNVVINNQGQVTDVIDLPNMIKAVHLAKAVLIEGEETISRLTGSPVSLATRKLKAEYIKNKK